MRRLSHKEKILLVVTAVLAVVAIFFGAYFALLLLALLAVVLLFRVQLKRASNRVSSFTTTRRYMTFATVGLAISAFFVWYVSAFIVEFVRCTDPVRGERFGLQLKFCYGTAQNADNPKAYSRSNKLGAFLRGDMALVDTPDGLLALRIVALPGDTVLIDNGSLFVNGRRSDVGGAVGSFRVCDNLSHSVKRKLSALTGVEVTGAVGQSLRLRLDEAEEFAGVLCSPSKPNFPDSCCFPWGRNSSWNPYQLGPFVLPESGSPISSGNKGEGSNVALALKNEPNAEGSFALDYYFALNDDRDVVNDSRLYGPIPESAIVSNLILF